MKKTVLSIILGLFSHFVLAQISTTVVHPDWSKNAAIYEANIRQFSTEGSFRKFEAYVPELKKMGVGVVWIMPVNPIGEKNRKGSLGSYYAVRDYTAVNPEFGSPADFKHLVDTIHAQGMRVIIDWVANHTSWDNVWVASHPEYYLKDDKGNFVPPVQDWADVIKLDYRNPKLRTAMIEAMKYWVTQYDVDGFRCDVAAMVPTDFWNQARAELDKLKPVFMLAEAYEPELQEHAFDMTYAWQFKNLFNDIAQGKKAVADLDAYLAGEETLYNANSYRMLHITNHDLNSWEGTEFERLGDATETFLVLSNLIKGMPLLYSGQEAGNAKRLEFFDRDPIEWKDHKFKRLYSTLFNLKKTNHALWNGKAGGTLQRIATSDDQAVFAFTRSKDGNTVIGIFNLSAKPQVVTMRGANGGGPDAGSYIDPFTNTAMVFDPKATLTLQPWEYRVYAK
jgi:cyclomaltodextrinase